LNFGVPAMFQLNFHMFSIIFPMMFPNMFPNKSSICPYHPLASYWEHVESCVNIEIYISMFLDL
jgi:hypothetical protein